MSNTENKSTWDIVNGNIHEIEKLLAQGKYNQVMIQSRKTVEYMVKALADQACIVDGDLSQMIDELYNGNWINKEACEHYHQIRVLGNKAVNESNNSATDANTCYQILAQEGYRFSHLSQRRRPTGTSRTSTARKRQKRKTGRDLLIAYALRVVVPLVILILVIFLVTRIVNLFSHDDKPTDTSAPTSTQLVISSESQTEESTSAPTEPAESEVVMYRAITTVNVRPEPNTVTDRIGKLSQNQTVEYLRDYDDSWVVVKYNGQEAYVAKQYLVPAE